MTDNHCARCGRSFTHSNQYTYVAIGGGWVAQDDPNRRRVCRGKLCLVNDDHKLAVWTTGVADWDR